MKKKYKASRDLPIIIRELKTQSPTEIAKEILKRFNQKRSPQSISIWMRKNRELADRILAEVVEQQMKDLVVDPSIFHNGAFEKIPSVATWIAEMKDRMTTPDYISRNVSALRRVCIGKFSNWKIDLVADGKWTLKHPDRLDLEDVKNIERLLRDDYGRDTSSVRLAMRNFLESKGIVVGKKISGAKGRGFGKLADLEIPHDTAKEIIAFVTEQNEEAGIVDQFLYETGTRIEATLNARIENIKTITTTNRHKKMVLSNGSKVNFQDLYVPLLNALGQKFNIVIEEDDETFRYITVFDKGRRSIYPEGKRWKKQISNRLWARLKKLIGDRKTGKIFSITHREMSDLNKWAYLEKIPDLAPKLRMPNHAWRHFHFQRTLRKNAYNYGLSAGIGGSTARSLEESYGKPPAVILQQMQTTVEDLFA